ncbi:hypothetical protein E5163_03180 [Marinicauda algicola]|uniref:Histidine kinase/HSP90-like ATPase domain-containing protein n=1 Tax=Marinicauda algicola TaxID=2029849 RepID=A0A4S2H3J8_9PROT|nr:ATP-binding protein [Marinicauda algicola]TGY90144.1 hypothetical protein E5163_03180 [Marinicauda algicola]
MAEFSEQSALREGLSRFRWSEGVVGWAAGLGLPGLVILAALLIPPIPGSLSAQRVPPHTIGWIEASWDLFPRHHTSRESLRAPRNLPASGDRNVQLFFFWQDSDTGPPPARLFLPAVSGASELYVNGAPIFAEPIASAPHIAHAGSRAELWSLPPEFFGPGRDRIDLVLSQSSGRASAGGIFIGSGDILSPLMDRYQGRSLFARHALMLLSIIAGLLALTYAALAGKSRTHVPAGFAALALSARTAWSGPDAQEMAGALWWVADKAMLGLVLLLLARSLQPRAAIRSPALGAAALFALALVLAPRQVEIAWWLSALALMTCAIPAGITVARSIPGPLELATQPAAGVQAVMLGVLLGVISAALLAGLGLTPSWATLVSETGYAIGALALCVILAGYAGAKCVHQIAAIVRTQFDLSRLVRMQREELDAKSIALQNEMRQRAVLEERQRLVRDMHDGVGGQLMSLLARVRAGRVGPDRIEPELVTSLNDLRLIVDSLDNAGDTLDTALATFRGRARAQLEAAGIALHWNQPGVLQMVVDNPRKILHIYRFLQEAVTNVIRHARASRLDVEVRCENGELIFTLRDDGIGYRPPAQGEGRAGKGVSNMEHRARQLDGTLRITALQPGAGTEVELAIPSPAILPS